jgi:enolase-phosphatase E1
MIKAIVTDIEGTTSSIDFVHDTLFPYANAHLRRFLREQAGNDAVQQLMDDVERIVGRDLSIDEAADVLQQWIAEDRKLTPLKSLQGMIWAIGYRNGELQGHVYADTPDALRRWHGEGRRLYVYSSGSVDAQKLIFGHTAYGDLTPLFSGYFDTRIGSKREAESYAAILREIGLPGEAVLFLSDVGAELDAAHAAGMRTIQLLRDAKAQPSGAHAHARSFSEIEL